MERLIAERVAISEMLEINTFAVIFYEKKDGSGWRIEFQRSITLADDDIDLGMDTYCICTEFGASIYGGIICWELTKNILHLSFEAAAADTLEIDKEMTIEILEPHIDIDMVMISLRRILQ